MVGLDNLVDFLIAVLTHANAAGQVFLISDGEDIGTAALGRKLAKAMNRRARLIPVPLFMLRAIGAVTGKKAVIERLTGSLQVDIRLAKQLLDWQPRVSLEQGIEQTVAHFVSTRNTKR